MQVVVIEYAFLQNFILDFTLLYLTSLTLKEKPHYPFLILSALMGTAFALVFPLFFLPKAVEIALKIAVGVVMCLISLKRGKLKKYLLFTLIFYGYTALYGGVMFFVENLFGVYAESIMDEGVLPLITVSGIALSVFTVSFIKLCGSKLKFYRESVRCRLSLKGNHVEERGIIDSGNMLFFKGNPVSVVSVSVAARLMGDFSGSTKLEKISVNTVNGEKRLNVMKIDELMIYYGDKKNIIEGAYVAISGSLRGGTSVLLNSDILF